uniref:UDP-glucuronosyltransferase n=1 Tax=Steinernema glaseri TaxID=37863 RepID=A0A1I7Y1J5_9BILA
MFPTVLCLLLLLGASEALKVLVNNPKLTHSHVEFQAAIADILAEAGHTVHLFVPIYDPTCNTKGASNASKIFEVEAGRLPFLDIPILNDPFNRKKNRESFSMLGDTTLKIQESASQMCDAILANDALLDQLRKEKYDVVITEFYEFCMLPLFHAAGIRVKIISSAVPMTEYVAQFYGIPVPRSYATSTLLSFANAPKLTYMQKAESLIWTAVDGYLMNGMVERMNAKMQKKFGPSFPDTKEIVQNTSLALINVVDVLDLAKPTSHKVVNVGGISRKNAKHTMEPEMERIFKKAQKGVVLFSFGSIADPIKMDPSARLAFLNAFARFPEFEFIWKFDPKDANDSKKVENVHFVKWMDQNTLLGQPKLRAFITHCGLNSVIESAFAGKPMVAVPLFADQNYNAAMVIQHRVAVFLEVEDVDEARVVAALSRILLEDDLYQNAQRLQRKLLRHPLDPRESVRKWIEYAAQFDDLHEDLNLEAVNLSFFSYFCLDVIASVAVVIAMIAFATLRVALLVWNAMLERLSTKKKTD